MDNNDEKEVPEVTPEETTEEEIETPEDTETAEEAGPDPESAEEAEPEPEEEEKPEIPYGETPKEWALRKELENVKGQLRKVRTDELFVPSEVPKIKTTLSPERQKLLEKYDSSQLEELGEIIKFKAEEMGFVKKDELHAETYKETADNLLNAFLEEHSEYLPENDKDNVLWNRFREEFSMYKQPQHPKDFKKIYNRVHESIFPVNSGNLNKINAQKEKLKTASHTGKTVGNVARQSKETVSNIRLDALKGFTQEELDELTS